MVALALGFPIAVVLAWAFDVNAGKIDRTPDSRSGGATAGPRGISLGLILVGIGLVCAAPGVAWYLVRVKATAAAAESGAAGGSPSIAVLPFASIGAERDQDYLGDGIAEEISRKLARLSGLVVAARTSVLPYKGKAQTPREQGALLGVTWLLGGERAPCGRPHPRQRHAAQGGRWLPRLDVPAQFDRSGRLRGVLQVSLRKTLHEWGFLLLCERCGPEGASGRRLR